MSTTIIENAETENARPWPSTRQEQEAGLSLVELLQLLLANIRLLILLPLIAAVVAAAITLSSKPQFVAVAKVRPQSAESSRNQIGGVAAQLGLVPTGSGDTPEFYAELVKTRGFLRDVVQAGYYARPSLKADALRGTLAELYNITGASTESRIRGAVDRLHNDVSATPQMRTGVVELRAVAATPELAEQIVRHLIARLGVYNLNKRQSQAGAERRFVEARLAASRKELTETEARLESFLRTNREFRQSPTLSLIADKLRGDVELRRQMHQSLVLAFEQARIDEVRNTPVFTVLEWPEHTVSAQGRSLKKNLVLAVAAGLICALGLIFFKLLLHRERSERPEQFAQLRELTVGSFRRRYARLGSSGNG